MELLPKHNSVGFYKTATKCDFPECKKLTHFYIIETMDSDSFTINLTTKEVHDVPNSHYESALEHPVCSKHLREILKDSKMS